MIIVRPNNSYRYQPMIEDQRAIEPPLWHIICADYFKADSVLDLEVNTDFYCLDMDRDFVLATGNNPTAQGYTTKLPMNPIEYKPRWDMIDLNNYRAHDWHARGYPTRSPYGVVYTSVSCPFSCQFCFSKDFYTTGYQERPIADVIADFKYLGEQGVTHIKIIDELFTFKTKRVAAICKAIEYLGFNFNIWCYSRLDTIDDVTLRYMKEAGINWIGYGIESGNERIRRQNGKGNLSNEEIDLLIKATRKYGIKSACNFIFGFEDDTMETMQQTLDLAYQLKCEYANFYCLVDKNVNQLSKDFLPRATKTLTPQQVLEFRDNTFRRGDAAFRTIALSMVASPANGIFFYNNIVDGQSSSIIRWGGYNLGSILHSDYNCFYSTVTPSQLFIIDRNNDTSEDATSWAEWKTFTGGDSHSIITDPKLTSETDFYLQATSPCIDAGNTLALVTTDYNGMTRPRGPGYDMGVYEYEPKEDVLNLTITLHSPTIATSPSDVNTSALAITMTLNAPTILNGGSVNVSVTVINITSTLLPVNTNYWSRVNKGADTWSNHSKSSDSWTKRTRTSDAWTKR